MEIISDSFEPGFTKKTPLLGWSMSKSVTNILTGILVKDNLLDIHAPAPVDTRNHHTDGLSRHCSIFAEPCNVIKNDRN